MNGKRTAPLEKETAPKSGKWGWIAAAAIAGVLTGAVLGFGFYADNYEGVFPGVTVGETDLSGLTRAELTGSLETDHLLSGAVTIAAAGENLGTYGQNELGAVVDRQALSDDAWSVGREPGFFGWFRNAWTMLRGKLGGKTELTPAVSPYDMGQLRRFAAQLAQGFDRAPVDGSYELNRDGLFATKPLDGRVLDQEGLVQSLEALGGGSGDIEAPWDTLPGTPLDLDAIARELDGEGTPARYDAALGRVVDGEPGVSLDTQAAAFVLEAASPGETVRLPAESSYPEMTAQELEAVLFRDVLGTATTNVSGTSVRKGNVRLSGELVNGTVLNDGDIFDYNEVVGERTTVRGFGAAPSYVNGQTVDTVGGGICQTSSTIYLAALNSNLEIVERYNHRFWPGYIPQGMDATVSWGGPEFRFKNNTGYPIRIDVVYSNSTLTVTIVGTKTDNTYVKMTNEILSTTGYDTVYEETDELSYGQQRQKQNGYTGYEVVTYRSVYSGDGSLISREVEAKSVYQKRDQIIQVGTAGGPAQTEGEPEEAPPDAGSQPDSGQSVWDEPELPPE